jgi:hypothetical protein
MRDDTLQKNVEKKEMAWDARGRDRRGDRHTLRRPEDAILEGLKCGAVRRKRHDC